MCMILASEHITVCSTDLQSTQLAFKEGEDAHFKFMFNYTNSMQDIIFKISLTGQSPLYEVGLSSNTSFLTAEEKKDLRYDSRTIYLTFLSKPFTRYM